MLVLFVFFLWFDSLTLAQFPDTETCHYNVGKYQDLLQRIIKGLASQGENIHPALLKGMQNDIDAWYWASLMQMPFGRPEVRYDAQQHLLELIGPDRFQLGVMPPAFIKHKTLKEGIN